MSDTEKGRAGTRWDWPVAVIAVGVLIAVLAWASGGSPSWAAWAVILFGIIALLIRRGAFTPRR